MSALGSQARGSCWCNLAGQVLKSLLGGRSCPLQQVQQHLGCRIQCKFVVIPVVKHSPGGGIAGLLASVKSHEPARVFGACCWLLSPVAVACCYKMWHIVSPVVWTECQVQQLLHIRVHQGISWYQGVSSPHIANVRCAPQRQFRPHWQTCSDIVS